MRCSATFIVLLCLAALLEAHSEKLLSGPRNLSPLAAVLSPAERLGAFPKSVDWRTKGYVSPVRNQGQVGDSLGFAAGANIEGIAAVASKTFVPVSEGFIGTCAVGPNGATMLTPYAWLLENTLGWVPGQGANTSQCNINSGAVQIVGYHFLPTVEESMARVVAYRGPIAVAVNGMPLQTYTGGVMTLSACSASTVDTAVAIVGYNLSANPPYWIIKNSWGTAWGESGYARISYGNNTCGVATSPITGQVAQ